MIRHRILIRDQDFIFNWVLSNSSKGDWLPALERLRWESIWVWAMGWAQKGACVVGLRGWMDHTQPGGQWVTHDPSWDLSCLISVLMPQRRRFSLLSASCQVMPNWWDQLVQPKAGLWPEGFRQWGLVSWQEPDGTQQGQMPKCPAHRKEEPFAVLQALRDSGAALWPMSRVSSGSKQGPAAPWAARAGAEPAVQGKGLSPFPQHSGHKYCTAALGP